MSQIHYKSWIYGLIQPDFVKNKNKRIFLFQPTKHLISIKMYIYYKR